ncbi:unnamed protein product [Bemisia tabaci]|uniref:Uncharacterized protein n=1 Tax=Bemisia tabaci TaxID=7038 RepID=A0A9P0AHT0_BEMTA|nr:unnamed protein product [Bemisia tabaci]
MHLLILTNRSTLNSLNQSSTHSINHLSTHIITQSNPQTSHHLSLNLQPSNHFTHIFQTCFHSNTQFHHSLLQPPTETPSQPQGSTVAANHRSPLATQPMLAPDWPPQSQPRLYMS